MTTSLLSKLPDAPSRLGRLAAAVAGFGLALVTTVSAFAATPVQKVKSPGGIEAWLIESHEVGLISMRFAFEGGSLAEPAGKDGVALMMTYLFNEGAGDMNTEQLSRQRMALGVNFGGTGDHTAAVISFTTPSAYRAESFAMLKLAMQRPRYDTDAIERARREYEAALTAEQTQPGSIASNHMSRRQFGDARLATSTYGTLASLKTITRDDIEAFRKRAFARSNLKVAVAGDIAPAELAPLLDDLFGALPATTDVPKRPATPPQKTSAELIRMDIPQTIVVMGSAAPRLTWRQSMAFAIGNHILSAPFTGRLFQEIREKRGLVYSINSGRYDTADSSVFTAFFGTGGENVRVALDETRREIDKFLAEGITEQEMAIVKESFIGSFFLSLDTNDKLVNQLLGMLRNDLPITFLDDYASEISKVTAADVTAALRLAIHPETMNVVVVGNPPADFKVEVAAKAP